MRVALHERVDAHSRFSRRRRPTAYGWLIAATAVGSLALIAVVGTPRTPDSRAQAGSQTPSLEVPSSGPESRPTSAAARIIYPYSVIPGGVLTPEDVENAMTRDPVVASHYAGLNARSLRVVRLLEPRDAYVSYRIGDQVFWTSRKLRVKAGETVLTDGNITVRARCGNQVADAPLGPTSPVEPSAEIFDAPGAPALLANGGAGGAAGASGGSSPAAESEWASAADSSQPRGTVLWPGFGPRRSTESGSPGPIAGPGEDPPSFDPAPPPDPGPPTAGPTPDPGPNPKPGPNADPDPGPDPNPGPKFGPTTDPDPGPNPRHDPRPGPPPSSDPDDGPVPVPEPTTLVLIGIGAGSAAIRHLRKRRSSPR